jgi:hypothetical protein
MNISTFGVIDPTRIVRPIQCPPADRSSIGPVEDVPASRIYSQPRPNTFSIFAKRWSTERMTNSAMSLPFSLRTATFPTPPRRLFNCPTAGPQGSVGRRFLEVQVGCRS